jgi:hypothetical protein
VWKADKAVQTNIRVVFKTLSIVLDLKLERRQILAGNLKLHPVTITVARWFIFKPKIPIWVNFGGP